MIRGEPTFFASSAALRAWLTKHHASATELWVGFYKASAGKPTVTYKEAVDEALCFGWIDGVRHGIDEESYCNRFTPRRKHSNWSAVNVARVAELASAKRMTAAGTRAFEARAAERTAVYSFERKTAATFSTAEAKLLRTNRKAAAFFGAQAPWYQRAATHWVISAKREETRARRLAELIADSAAGRTIKLLTRKPKG